MRRQKPYPNYKFFFQEFYDIELYTEPLVVSCVLYSQFENRTARGVSVCSPQDIPDKIVGRKEAERYALHAMKLRGNVMITDKRAVRTVARCECYFTHHAEVNPVLAFHERKALSGTYKPIWLSSGAVGCPDAGRIYAGSFPSLRKS